MNTHQNDATNEHGSTHHCHHESHEHKPSEDAAEPQSKGSRLHMGHIAMCGAATVIILFGYFFDVSVSPRRPIAVSDSGTPQDAKSLQASLPLEEQVMPVAGIALPIRWEDMGQRMIDAGVIDAERFEQLYAQRGGIPDDMRSMMGDHSGEHVIMTRDNAGFLLNMLWAFGLANKNEILEQGPMSDPRYGGADKFASTGGWTLSRGHVMNHYSMHSFVPLTPDQQNLVERVSQNIYRPCCGNGVHFPDCNHGMAMLGLLELMAASGVTEEKMYSVALAVNAYWFPDTYLTIAQYFANRGVAWSAVQPKEVLGAAYSGAAGYKRILSEVQPQQSQGGQGCGA
jgi:hypothetical protein